jgi:hypothetical protein
MSPVCFAVDLQRNNFQGRWYNEATNEYEKRKTTCGKTWEECKRFCENSKVVKNRGSDGKYRFTGDEYLRAWKNGTDLVVGAGRHRNGYAKKGGFLAPRENKAPPMCTSQIKAKLNRCSSCCCKAGLTTQSISHSLLSGSYEVPT